MISPHHRDQRGLQTPLLLPCHSSAQEHAIAPTFLFLINSKLFPMPFQSQFIYPLVPVPLKVMHCFSSMLCFLLVLYPIFSSLLRITKILLNSFHISGTVFYISLFHPQISPAMRVSSSTPWLLQMSFLWLAQHHTAGKWIQTQSNWAKCHCLLKGYGEAYLNHILPVRF